MNRTILGNEYQNLCDRYLSFVSMSTNEPLTNNSLDPLCHGLQDICRFLDQTFCDLQAHLRTCDCGCNSHWSKLDGARIRAATVNFQCKELRQQFLNGNHDLAASAKLVVEVRTFLCYLRYLESVPNLNCFF